MSIGNRPATAALMKSSGRRIFNININIKMNLYRFSNT